MQEFRSLSEIDQVQLPPNQRRAVTQAVRTLLEVYGDDYEPDDCGYVVLIDQNTTDAQGQELLGCPWSEALLEGASYDFGDCCFLTCVLFNNQFGLTIIVPDEPWLDPRFRNRLEAELYSSGGAQ